MQVILPTSLVMQAANIGVLRQVSNIQERRKERYGAKPEYDWQNHVQGCLGEFIVARTLGLFWDGKLGDLSTGDVGKLEVRTTAKDKGDLVLHDYDRDNSIFILVTGCNDRFNIRGWILGSIGKTVGVWESRNNRPPAFWVKQKQLRSFEEIRNALTIKFELKVDPEPLEFQRIKPVEAEAE